jgi:2,3-bisphosphoglycerate-independent phosphoglycerate mutase
VLNKFLYRANKTLSKDPINKKRKIPANTVLIRNVGHPRKTPSFQSRFGMKACCIAGIAIAKGVARYLGIDVIDVSGATGLPNTNLEGKTLAAEKALQKYDFVFLHINGTDTYSHDRKPELKKKLIEKIDNVVFSKLKPDLKTWMAAVTCDHRTASSPEREGYEHLTEPVPFLAAGGRIRQEVNPYTEAWCEKSRLRLEGNGLMEFLVRNSR